jgi:tetratricopeptide (TPR) repeat protein
MNIKRTTAMPSDQKPARISGPAFLAVFVLICFLTGLYARWILRLSRASRLAATHEAVSLSRAIALEPANASYFDQLGQYEMWQAQDPLAAASRFQQAVQLNPYASSYWRHLAQSEDTLGNGPGALNAIRQSIAVDPMTPDVAWNAGNFFLLQGRTQEALDQFAVVVRNDPLQADTALQVSLRATQDVDAVSRRLPPNPEVYLKFIKLLIGQRQWAAADHTWSAMLELHQEFDPHSALFYVDALLANHDGARAQQVWQQLVTSGSLQSRIHPGNLVVNPGFDQNLLNAGFDWRYSAQPGASVALDQTQFYGGGQSMLVKFWAPNSDIGLSQYVVVVPGTSYLASAWVKSEELETANGPVLAVCDAYSNVEYVHSEETMGSSTWHRVQAAFVAEQGTNVIVLRFLRHPESTQITGRFWIDSVELSPVGSETK